MTSKIYSPTIKEAVEFTNARLRLAHVPKGVAQTVVSAMVEGVGNAIRHAKVGGKPKFVLSVRATNRHVTIEVTDFGPGFSLDGQSMPALLAEGRRGIPIMKALMDAVEYVRSDNGNRLRLKKFLA
ncbi:MAG TPA: ATP-binding protein [Candidatus Eremiobacteraceae bacterium]|nr:ATP-binding protein [Candidatus Eremiobacteraceae bacterium]